MSELVIRDEGGYLAALSDMRALVEQIESVDEAKDLADRARAAQVWAERAGLEVAKVNLAIVTKLWAERRAGELLSAFVTPGYKSETNLPEGVSRMQSSRWQQLAGLPLSHYEKAVADAMKAGRVTLGEVFRRVERLAREKAAAEAEAELVAELEARGGPTWSIEEADLRDFNPGTVDVIVTDPPYITADSPELYSALGDFAVRVLRPGGGLFAMASQPFLPSVIKALTRPELAYRWTIAWVSGAHESTADRECRVFDRWKPVLVYHRGPWPAKAPMITDVVNSGRDLQKTTHPWQQTLGGFRQLVRAASRTGDLVCDPFVGGGTTCLAALAENRSFVGCDIDPKAVASAHARLAA